MITVTETGITTFYDFEKRKKNKVLYFAFSKVPILKVL